MPIYEYKCEKCDKVFEEWVKQAEEDDVTHPCPDCDAQCRRLMSQTTFVLAGGGWYATEYGNRRSSAAGKSSSGKSSKSSSESSSTSGPASSGQGAS